MSLAIIAPGRNREEWVEAIHALDPGIKVEIHPDIADRSEVEGAIVWSYPYGVLKEFSNLKWVSSIGAGVDYILNDPHFPERVTLTRIVDKNLSRDMKRTATLAVLSRENRLPDYLELDHWEKLGRRRIDTIGILGMGEMGKAIGQSLYHLGYSVKGYSKSKKDISGITSYYGSITNGFLNDLDVLINVLPLTSSTEGILNKELFDTLKKGTYIVNLGRGVHLQEDDLVESIKSGKISGAWLDVFKTEPLPDNHVFWSIPEITIMPHVASVTDPSSAAEVVVENYHRLKEGGVLLHQIVRERGY